MSNSTKQQTPKSMPMKYSMHALLYVLKEKKADEYNPISKRDALLGVEEYLTKKGYLGEHDRAPTKSGSVRWEGSLLWYFIDLQKGNFARRKRGQWWITKEGEDVVKEGPDVVYQRAADAYKAWDAERKLASNAPKTSELNDDSELSEDAYNAKGVLEDVQDKALHGIEERLKKIDPYEFQNLVADILIATGLTVQDIAPRGPDGGVDITATTDALGVQRPRLRVQVKHQLISGTPISSKEVQALRGAIDQQTDTGMLVSSSRFTKDAEKAALQSPHIKLIDLFGLLDLLDQHYDKLPSRGQRLLSLKKVYFLKPEEDE